MVAESDALSLGIRLFANVLRGVALRDSVPLSLSRVAPAALILGRFRLFGVHEEAEWPFMARSV